MAKHQRRTAIAAGQAARPAPQPPGLDASDPAHPLEPPEPANEKSRGYLEAVALYQEGIRLIQLHDFAPAANRLGRVVAAYAHERELCERARLYLSLCDRHLRPATDEPQSLAERIYAATLALNAADAGRAIGFLEGVLREDPTNDQALYMLASAYAQRGDVQVAIPYLQQAIASNPDNRALARVDPDLADLRAEDTFAALLQSPLDSARPSTSSGRPRAQSRGRGEPSASSQTFPRDDRKRSVPSDGAH